MNSTPEQLYAQFHDKIRNVMKYHFPLIDTISDFEDLVQDVSVAVWKAAKKHDSAKYEDRQFLIGLAGRVVRSAIQREFQNRKCQLFPIYYTERTLWEKDKRPSVETQVIRKILYEQGLALVDALPDTLRDVMLMYYVKDMTAPEIGRKLGISRQGVEWRRNEALSMIRPQVEAL